ncbi:MAG: hypothetical protein V4690_00465 [Patescibacteria group bacterium]
MKKATKNDDGVKTALVGLGIAGIAATAYFFLGPKGKKHQKYAKAWAIKMKADVIEKLEMAKDMNEVKYTQVIDEIASKYEKAKKATNEEIADLATDLKKHWKVLSGKKVTPKRKPAKK